MTLAINLMLLLLHLLILTKAARRFGFHRYQFIALVVVFFYSMSLQLDYLLLGIDEVSSTSMGSRLGVMDTQYLVINLLYICFSLSFLFFSIKAERVSFGGIRSGVAIENRTSINKPLYLLVAMALCFIMVSSSLSKYGLGRGEIKEDASAFSVVISQAAIYMTCILVLIDRKNRYITGLLLLAFAFYAMASFERENAILLLMLVFYTFCIVPAANGRYKVRYVRSLVLLSLGVAFLYIYKGLVLYLITSGMDYSSKTALVGSAGNFSFSAIDPAVTLMLIKEYLVKDIYGGYYFSYVTNTLLQFLSFLGVGDHVSLGRYATEYYTGGSMGTGFSMIVESMLNFYYFGPFILGMVLPFFLRYGYVRLARFGLAADMLLGFVLIKLVRTEFAVILKLYVVPLIVASIAIRMLIGLKARREPVAGADL